MPVKKNKPEVIAPLLSHGHMETSESMAKYNLLLPLNEVYLLRLEHLRVLTRNFIRESVQNGKTTPAAAEDVSLSFSTSGMPLADPGFIKVSVSSGLNGGAYLDKDVLKLITSLAMHLDTECFKSTSTETPVAELRQKLNVARA